MRLVLDTNVLFAAFLSRGTCATLFERILAKETLITSKHILTELEEKLMLKIKLTAAEAATVRQRISASAIIVDAITLPDRVCRDPDDDVILGTAVASSADLIVTGDKDLLVLSTYQGIPIVTPGTCLARLHAI